MPRSAPPSVPREVLGGFTTFAALSYILFVQPAMLSSAGMDRQGVFLATCLASALATFLMGAWAKLPIALAPGMGHNALFVFTLCGTLGLFWNQALALTIVSGTLFLALGLVRFRERIVAILTPSMRHAIAAGIGLLIAMVGFQWSGIVVGHPDTLLTLGRLDDPTTVTALIGLAATLLFLAWNVRAAVLLGIAAATAWGAHHGQIHVDELVRWPEWSTATAFQMDFRSLADLPLALLVEAVLVLFLLDLFDTVGTLVGTTERAGLKPDEGHLARAFASDAVGTIAGGFLGTSTVTSYVESAAGIDAGARTGLAAIVTSVCFLLALFFEPLIAAVGAGMIDAAGRPRNPVLASALIAVGFSMARSFAKVDWERVEEGFPAFLVAAILPLTLSITDGIAFGLIAQAFLFVVLGLWNRLSPTLWIVVGLFAVRYVEPLREWVWRALS